MIIRLYLAKDKDEEENEGRWTEGNQGGGAKEEEKKMKKKLHWQF